MRKIIFLLFLSLISITIHAQSTISTTAVIPDPQTGYGDFNITSYSFDVNGETQRDHVVRFGHNCAEGGGRAVSGKAAICWEFEKHYRPGGPTDPREWMEVHLAGTNKMGTITERGFSFLFDENSGSFTTIFQSGNINFVGDDGNLKLQITGPYLLLDNGEVIRSVNNGANIIQQYKAGGGVVNVVRVNTSNKVELGAPINVLGSISINGTEVLTGKCSAIVDSDGTLADNTRAMNALLACLRTIKLVTP